MASALQRLAAELGHAYRVGERSLLPEDRQLLVPLREILRDVGQRLRPRSGLSLQANVARGPVHMPDLLEFLSALASPATPTGGSTGPAPSTPPCLLRPGVRFAAAETREFEVPDSEILGKLRPGRVAASLPEPSATSSHDGVRGGGHPRPVRSEAVATATLLHPGRARARRLRAQHRVSELWLAAGASGLGASSASGRARPDSVEVAVGPGEAAQDSLDDSLIDWIDSWVHNMNAEGRLESLRMQDFTNQLLGLFGSFTDRALADAKSRVRVLVDRLFPAGSQSSAPTPYPFARTTTSPLELRLLQERALASGSPDSKEEVEDTEEGELSSTSSSQGGDGSG